MIKSIRLEWAGRIAKLKESRSALKNLTGKPTGNRRLGRPGRRWEDNNRVEIGKNTRNWVDSAQYRGYWRSLVNAVLNLQVP